MAYTQSISGQWPGCFVLVVDQTLATWRGVGGTPAPKARAVANEVNRFLGELVSMCEKGEDKPRHWFDVGLVGYTTDDQGGPVVGSAWGGALAGRELVGIPDLYDHPQGVETRTRVETREDGAGGTTEVPVEVHLPVWYRPPPPTEDAARALLRTALDRPADVTPWLVYADWLDDRDDPRAGAIRAELRDDGSGDFGLPLQRLRNQFTPNWDAGPYHPSPADTPMAAGLGRAAEVVAGWVAEHPDNFPPFVVHLTGGDPFGPDAEVQADRLKALATADGNVLVHHALYTDQPHAGKMCPLDPGWMPAGVGRALFRMASRVPDQIAERLNLAEYGSPPYGCRYVSANAPVTRILRVMQRGTPPVSDRPPHLR